MTEPVDGLVGTSVVIGPITLRDSRMGVAHSLLWSTGELHTNDQAMAGTRFGRRVATGPWVAAVVAGAFDAGEGRRLLDAHHLRLADLESQTITYHAPIAADTAFRVRAEISDLAMDATSGRVTISEVCELETGEIALRSVRIHGIESTLAASSASLTGP